MEHSVENFITSLWKISVMASSGFCVISAAKKGYFCMNSKKDDESGEGHRNTDSLAEVWTMWNNVVCDVTRFKLLWKSELSG